MRLKTGAKSGLNKSPGPGAYNPKIDFSKENLGGIKIGTGTRDSHGALAGAKEVPGPGQYELKRSLNGPAFGIGTSQREHGSG